MKFRMYRKYTVSIFMEIYILGKKTILLHNTYFNLHTHRCHENKESMKIAKISKIENNSEICRKCWYIR